MTPRLLLVEHRPTRIPRSEFPDAQISELALKYSKYLDVAFPSILTNDCWQVSSKGWVGAVALSGGLQVIVQPKVPIANLAKMLQFAYELPIDFFDGLAAASTLADLYDQLVCRLSRLVLSLARQGLHHEYRRVAREMGVVRGRIDVSRFVRRPISAKVPCILSERTSNVVENQLLAFTLNRVLRSGLCSSAVQSEARGAYRLLATDVSDVNRGYQSLDEIQYTRLTERYRLPHTLCRLLLAEAAPIAKPGDDSVVPFLLNMPRLFELMVAKWLQIRLAPDIVVDAQRRRRVGEASEVEFVIDIVLRRPDGRAVCVLDTKYKDSSLPASDDVAQVGYYALLEHCQLAGLVVPTDIKRAWQGKAGDVETFRAGFDLDGDLEVSGKSLLVDLLARIRRHETVETRERST